MRFRIALGALVGAALVTAGCGSDTDTVAPGTETTDGTATRPETVTETSVDSEVDSQLEVATDGSTAGSATEVAEVSVETTTETETTADTEVSAETTADTEVIAETTADTEVIAETPPGPSCGKNGMTWALVATTASGAAKVDCSGCDPSFGDTCCAEERPVLCILTGTAAKPADFIEGAQYRRWSGGEVKATPPVAGTSLRTRSEANALCATTFGAGWRVAEFHDGVGWGLWAFGDLSEGIRYWVDINDQPDGTCWNWSCDDAMLGDGVCDCGCSAKDPDCGTGDTVACERCQRCFGANSVACDMSLAAAEASLCVDPDIPAAWTCGSSRYWDGVCDCGCGVKDLDCTRTTFPDECVAGCYPDPTDTTKCRAIEVPPTWNCDQGRYADRICDCGCGAQDYDCPDTTDVAACVRGCIPEALDTTQCMALDVPTTWSCPVDTFGDHVCDCGCGAEDYDCPSNTLDACQTVACAPLDPADTTRCIPIPATWACPEEWFVDYACDCGCGAQDFTCATTDDPNACDFDGCGFRRAGSHADPTDTTQCIE